jgi:NTE family protein
VGPSLVVAVDAGQELQAREPANGFEALSRAVEICQRTHAHLRLERADLVLVPAFGRPIDTLEFTARRGCVAAGAREVRRRRHELAALLESNPAVASRRCGGASYHCEEYLG